MAYLAFKYLLTAALVVLISEAAKRSDKAGAIIAALPLVTVLTLIWLHVEKQPQEKVANHAYYTFWYVLPTLPMFVAFPALLDRVGFWWTMAASLAITVVSFAILATVLKRFAIDLI